MCTVQVFITYLQWGAGKLQISCINSAYGQEVNHFNFIVLAVCYATYHPMLLRDSQLGVHLFNNNCVGRSSKTALPTSILVPAMTGRH